MGRCISMHGGGPRWRSPGHTKLRPRRGGVRWDLLGAIGGGAILLAVGGWSLQNLGSAAVPIDMVTQRATVGVFQHDVVERGELESSANTTVRCEVQARAGSSGVKIIEIVPEGSSVKEGDFLVKFDDATLQNDRTTQLIAVSSAEAAFAQSENELIAARIARKEYEFGEFESEREKIRGELLVAKENESRASDGLDFYRSLVRKGYGYWASKIRTATFDLEKARSDLKMAKTKLNALEEFTFAKKISELDAKTKTAEAKVKSDQAKFDLERKKLEVIDDQIAKCTIKAPKDGQVVYDHEQDQWRGAEHMIKAGTIVNEQRVIIRLPDPTQMQVVAKVAESRIDLIKVDMPATVEVEGLPGVQLKGKVTRVNEYPSPEGWSSGKEYGTTVAILEPPTGLRPGMTAKVAVRVKTIDSVLQVPNQAVIERGGKHYCLVVDSSGTPRPREVLIGSDNEKFLVIRDGLSANDEVLLNPRAHAAGMHFDEPAAEKPAGVAKEQKPADDDASSLPKQARASLGGVAP